jgi:hypothetical protein
MEDYLTLEFLNDLDIFDYDTFVSQYGFETEEKTMGIEVFLIENKNKETFDCAICMETHLEVNGVALNCNHPFCVPCISNYLQHTKTQNTTPCCALCREPYSTLKVSNVEYLQSISKIVMN